MKTQLMLFYLKILKQTPLLCVYTARSCNPFRRALLSPLMLWPRYVRLFGPRLPVGLVKVALPTLDLASDCLQMTLPLAPWCGTALISQSKI